MQMLTLILLLFMLLLFFAVKHGFFLEAGGTGDNGHLPRASAIVVFTVPFIGYLS